MTRDVGFDLETTDRLLTTTRAVRKQLDLTRPVPRQIIEECLEIALHAPNATNAQAWHWVVVSDPVLRAEIGDIYREVLLPVSSRLRAEREAQHDQDAVRHSDSVLYLIEHLAEVPVHVIPCAAGAIGPDSSLAEVTGILGSIYPAVWSFQLALRSRGLGSTFTNAHLLRAEQVGDLLGIPSHYTQTCLIPAAYTARVDFGAAKRRPISEVASFNGWGANAP